MGVNIQKLDPDQYLNNRVSPHDWRERFLCILAFPSNMVTAQMPIIDLGLEVTV